MEMMPELSDDSAKLLLADTLRMFVGQGRRISWADLAGATGDEERKLRSYVDRDPASMPAPVFMRVFTVLPPEAFARVAGRMGFGAPARLERDRDATARRAAAQAARLVANINDRWEDGHWSAKDEADTADEAAALIPTLQAVVDTKG